MLSRTLLSRGFFLRSSTLTPWSQVSLRACSKSTAELDVSQLVVKTTPALGQKPVEAGPFGHIFSPYMLECDWNDSTGWAAPVIRDFGPLKLHPGATVLHYATELFEGIKAYRGDDGCVRIFRIDRNMNRMYATAVRASLPKFDKNNLTKLICRLLKENMNSILAGPGTSLYIRPTLIGTEPHIGIRRPKNAKLFVITCPVANNYHNLGATKGAILYANPNYIRVGSGGVGAFKMGCNYAPTIFVGEEAAANQCHETLWLYGPKESLTEAGTMNVFAIMKEGGKDVLMTPSLESGLILPGVTRDSILTIAQELGVETRETEINFADVKKAAKAGNLSGIFGSGTAVMVQPVEAIKYINGKNEPEIIKVPVDNSEQGIMFRLRKALDDIHRGRTPREDWITLIK